MISWIQNTFQKHFRLVFAILLAGMIVPFVFTIGSTPGIGRADRAITNRDFFGYNIASQQDVARLQSEAQVSAGLQRLPIYSEQMLVTYANIRAAALHLADTYHIPAPTDDQLKDFIKTLPQFQGQDGQFDVNAYSQLREMYSSNGADGRLAQVIKDDYRASQVENLLSGPGYILPRDVAATLQIADTQWTLSTAKLDYDTFKPASNPTDEELTKYFQANAARYQIPEKVQVEEIEFPALALYEQAQVSDDEVRAYYDAHAKDFPAPSGAPLKAPAMKPDAAANYLLVKDKVTTRARLAKADDLALKNASDFSVALYDSKIPRGDALVQFVKAHGLTMHLLAPFSADQEVPELDDSTEAAEAAFRLNSDRYFSDAFPTPGGAAVLIWVATIPSRPSTFAEARDRVLGDYTENSRRLRFAEAERAVRSQLQSALSSGQPFDKAAAAAGALAGVKVAAKNYPAFSFNSPNVPKDLPPGTVQVLETLKKGQLSQPDPSGLLVYVADAKQPAVTEANPDYQRIRDRLAAEGAHQAPEAELNAMVEAELARTAPSVK